MPRLRQHEAVGREKPVQLRGALVITGGLGGLGLRAAKALSGGTHAIVLASRSGKVARDGQGLDGALAALQQATSRVRCLAADASAVDQVKHMTHVSGEPLGGVLHAARLHRVEAGEDRRRGPGSPPPLCAEVVNLPMKVPKCLPPSTSSP